VAIQSSSWALQCSKPQYWIILKASNQQGTVTNNATNFCFTLLTNAQAEISQFTITLLKAHLDFNVISTFVNSPLPPMNKNMYSFAAKLLSLLYSHRHTIYSAPSEA
jgi:hypothetical protein